MVDEVVTGLLFDELLKGLGDELAIGLVVEGVLKGLLDEDTLKGLLDELVNGFLLLSSLESSLGFSTGLTSALGAG